MRRLENYQKDRMIPVQVEKEFDPDNKVVFTRCSEEGGAGPTCLPRSVELELKYFQVSQRRKRLIRATMKLSDFDFNTKNTAYEFTFSLVPLDWGELLLEFAFTTQLYLVVFFLFGLGIIIIDGLHWIIRRFTTRLKDPPKFQYWDYVKITFPPALAGVLLAVIPILLVVFFMLIILRGDLMKLDNDCAEFSPCKLFQMVPNSYSEEAAEMSDKKVYIPIRCGRVASALLCIGLYLVLVGCRIFVPNRVSKKELEVQTAHNKELAEKTQIWIPTTWKRFNLVFWSIVMIIICWAIIEFTFSDIYDFSPLVFIALAAIGGTVLEYAMAPRLQEALLMAPPNTLYVMTTALITMGTGKLDEFLLGYLLEFFIALAIRVYLSTIIGNVLDFCVDKFMAGRIWLQRKLKLKERTDFELEKERGEKLEEARQQREVDVGGGTDTVEPILGDYSGYANDLTMLLISPVVYVFLIMMREELILPKQYEIKESDMVYFLMFSVIMLFMQTLADIFVHNVLELFMGWKILDYLVYASYRFNQREKRWKGYEDGLDECIEESLRTLDQMCFSSQFYFMHAIYTMGLVIIMFAVLSLVHKEVNLFDDPMTLLIWVFLMLIMWSGQKLLVWLALKCGVWRLKHADTQWHAARGDDDEGDFGIPGWDELEALQHASHEAYILNQKITSETFRHKFLDYNRAWLVAQLPNILTPRTKHRSRPYLIQQLDKVLGKINPEITSDTSGDEKHMTFPPVTLSTTSATIARLWLSQARRRRLFRSVVQPIIERARRPECENCLSKRNLQVELVIPIEVLGDRFEKAYPDMVEFDKVAWKEFFQKHETFRTICLDCIEKRTQEEKLKRMGEEVPTLDKVLDEEDRPMFPKPQLTDAAKRMLKTWLANARKRLVKSHPLNVMIDQLGLKPEVSDDDSDDDLLNLKLTRKPLAINAASAAIARLWLQKAKARVEQRKGTAFGSSRMVNRLVFMKKRMQKLRSRRK